MQSDHPIDVVRAVSVSVSRQYLMIGDSISLGYLPGVATALAAHDVVTTHSAGNAGNANSIAHELPCAATSTSV